VAELSREELKARVDEVSKMVSAIREEVGKVIVGQRYMIDRLLIGLMARGHILLEGVPGLAKTTAVKTVARALRMEFSRIQFTPDLLPADVAGTQIYNLKTSTFSTHQGPLFANLVLADEINRAPPKTQAATLEAMQERQVTIGDLTYKLPEPFLVLATQNPIEQEGTYPLPEAQTDRFMLKLKVGYPTKLEEREIMRRAFLPAPPIVDEVCTARDLMAAQDLVRSIRAEQAVMDYVIDLVHATRDPDGAGLGLGRYIQFGASPRASIAMLAAARAHALLDGRIYVTPDDIKSIGPDVLRHRVVLSYEAEAEDMDVDAVLAQFFQRVDVA
jgi:MoxR-like ATPase